MRGSPVVLVSKRGRSYRKLVKGLVLERGIRSFGDDLVRVHITLHAPDERRRDLDNLTKALFDALTHAGVWADDFNVWEYTVTRGKVDRSNPRIKVLVMKYNA